MGELDQRLRFELLRIVSLPHEQRVSEIGRFFSTGERPEWTELLIDLETDELAAAAVLDALRVSKVTEEERRGHAAP